MLISPAFAGHFMADDGNTGSGDTLLIILGVGLVLGLLYMSQKNGAGVCWPAKARVSHGSSEPIQADRFVSEQDQTYCLMWLNRSLMKASLTYRVTGP